MLLHCRRVCVSDTMVNVADVVHFGWVALFCVASSVKDMAACSREGGTVHASSQHTWSPEC